jgi:ribosome-associated translation inhibitor RaiA
MQIKVSWSNLNEEIYATEFNSIIKKNEAKLKKFLTDADFKEVILDFGFKYQKSEKAFVCNFKVRAPGLDFRTSQKGYRLEEAINNCITTFTRNLTEDKERKIQTSRQKPDTLIENI